MTKQPDLPSRDLGGFETPDTAQASGNQADKLYSCCGWELDPDDGFCHECWEHCL